MDRLTVRNSNGVACYNTPTREPIQWENNRHKVLQKLAYYEDLDESGKLLKLPCRVGDTLYLLDHECTEGMKYNCEIDGIMEGYLCRNCGTYPCTLHPSVQEVVVDSITILDNNEIIIEFKDLREIKIEDFSKTTFLTREEAENKLKEISDEKSFA